MHRDRCRGALNPGRVDTLRVDAPWWLRGLLHGLVAGLVFGGLAAALRHYLSTDSGMAGAYPGLIFGGLTGVGAAVTARRAGPPPELVGLSAAQQHEARRAMITGPVPCNPTTRSASYQLAQRSLDRRDDMRPVSRLLLLAVIAVNVAMAAAGDNAFGWVSATVLTVVLTRHFTEQHRLARRTPLLRPSPMAPND